MSAFHPHCLILIETQSELIDRQRTAVRRGRSRYKHWLHLGRIPCPTALRLYYKAADNSMAAAKGPHGQQQPSFFLFYWPHIIHALRDSHPSCLGGLGGCHDVQRKPCHGFTAATTSWNNNSVGKCNSATFPSCFPDKNNMIDITLLCPSIKSPLPNSGCNTDRPMEKPVISNNNLCYSALATVRIWHTDASDSLMDFHMD